MTIRIAIASDLSGFPLKQALIEHLAARQDVTVLDLGIPSEDEPKPYFIQAPKVVAAIHEGNADRGILVCGTGQGMAIVANKYPGIYACVVTDVFSGERASIINNANVITMGGWVTAPFVAKEIVDGWLAMQFTQKMEFKADFLKNAFAQVQEIEKNNFKSSH